MPPAIEHLYLTDPIPDFGRIDGMMFSGGVGEYVYGRETRDFGDIGRRLGEAIRRKIDAGLAGSRFGVVILSRSFFAKGWPQYELDGLVTRQVSGEQSLLPIWHDITKDEVKAQSPSLADKIARSTAQYTIEEIAHEIADLVRPAVDINPE